MKQLLKWLLLFCLSICVLYQMTVYVMAEKTLQDVEDLKQTELTAEQQETYWRLLELQEIPIPDKFQSRIVSFDVSNQNEIILALENDRLLILNEAGEALHYFRFSCFGSYYVQWSNQQLLLYDLRSNLVFFFLADGTMIKVTEVPTNSSYDSIVRDILAKRTVLQNGAEYSVEKPDGISGFFSGYAYDRLTCSNHEETRILYSVGNTGAFSVTRSVVPLLLIVGISVLIIVRGVLIPRLVRYIVNMEQDTRGRSQRH